MSHPHIPISGAKVLFKADEQDLTHLTPFQAASYFFDQAADRIGLSEAVATILRTPYREIRVQLPLLKGTTASRC